MNLEPTATSPASIESSEALPGFEIHAGLGIPSLR
jgi:hypothetical protein